MQTRRMTIRPTALAASAAISIPYASQLLSGEREPSRTVALRVYDAVGLQLGFLANLSASEIAMIRKIDPELTPKAAA